jgi:hypothetical protein
MERLANELLRNANPGMSKFHPLMNNTPLKYKCLIIFPKIRVMKNQTERNFYEQTQVAICTLQ